MKISPNIRRALYVVVPALLVGALALPRALAWHHHHVESSVELGERLDDGLDYLLHKVDASDAQHKQADAIVQKRAPELYAVISEGREVRKQLKQALLAEQVDAAKVQAVRGRLDALTKQASDIGLASLTEVAQLLTPAQRKQLSDRLARFEH
ncbi:MAG: periplasmic heavy metal sensor [Polyangiales bacterium]